MGNGAILDISGHDVSEPVTKPVRRGVDGGVWAVDLVIKVQVSETFWTKKPDLCS